MPAYINVTLRNSTSGQHVYHATDDVLGQAVLANTPLAPNEVAAIQLVADSSGNGRMTYGYLGGADYARIDLHDGDNVDD